MVPPRPPRPAELAGLAGLAVPTLVVVAGRSRSHDPAQVLRRAQQLLPGAQTATLPEATHHTIPTEDAARLASEISPFLGSGEAFRSASSGPDPAP
jgi:pimeloyl-ACP methyl ester carboxylesterase